MKINNHTVKKNKTTSQCNQERNGGHWYYLFLYGKMLYKISRSSSEDSTFKHDILKHFQAYGKPNA
jgi:hypothetical protein